MLSRPQMCYASRQRTEVKRGCCISLALRAPSFSCCLLTAFTSNATQHWYATVDVEIASYNGTGHCVCVSSLSDAGPADRQIWTGVPVLGGRVSRARKAHSSAWQPTAHVHARPPCCHGRDGPERSVSLFDVIFTPALCTFQFAQGCAWCCRL